ncbi:MAG: YidC/Oxa1 family membrane protein insertase [Bacillota bacterium]
MRELFGSLVKGMTFLLTWLYNGTAAVGLPSYGLAIILLTVIVRVLLYPLNYKQMHSMLALQRLQPKVKEIQEKYRKDPQKLQQKMMELYQEHGVNPLGGCLPLLIQLPILIALYSALLHFPYAVAEHARFLWVPSLSGKDPYFLLPILAGATTYWQMRVTPQAGGQEQMQRMMTLTMPVLFLWISSTLPAGLALYWVTFNVLSVGQQYLINRRLLAGKEAVQTDEGSNKERKNGSGGGAGRVAGAASQSGRSSRGGAQRTDEGVVRARRGKTGRRQGNT